LFFNCLILFLFLFYFLFKPKKTSFSSSILLISSPIILYITLIYSSESDSFNFFEISLLSASTLFEYLFSYLMLLSSLICFYFFSFYVTTFIIYIFLYFFFRIIIIFYFINSYIFFINSLWILFDQYCISAIWWLVDYKGFYIILN